MKIGTRVSHHENYIAKTAPKKRRNPYPSERAMLLRDLEVIGAHLAYALLTFNWDYVAGVFSAIPPSSGSEYYAFFEGVICYKNVVQAVLVWGHKSKPTKISVHSRSFFTHILDQITVLSKFD